MWSAGCEVEYVCITRPFPGIDSPKFYEEPCFSQGEGTLVTHRENRTRSRSPCLQTSTPYRRPIISNGKPQRTGPISRRSTRVWTRYWNPSPHDYIRFNDLQLSSDHRWWKKEGIRRFPIEESSRKSVSLIVLSRLHNPRTKF